MSQKKKEPDNSSKKRRLTGERAHYEKSENGQFSQRDEPSSAKHRNAGRIRKTEIRTNPPPSPIISKKEKGTK